MNNRFRLIRRPIIPLLVFTPLLIIGLIGCNGSPKAPDTPVTAPRGPEITVDAGKDVPIRVSATGADRYEWNLEGKGRISATSGEALLFTPPDDGGTVRLTVKAFNKEGGSSQTTLTISVLAKASIGLGELAIPAGWMSDRGNPEKFVSLERNPNGCVSGQGCFRFTYRQGGKWGGLCWWPLRCGSSGIPEVWDKVRNGTCGISVSQMGGLKAVNRLTFQARGDRGGEVIEFKVGAVDLLPKPGKSLGRVTLTPNWEGYEIDLKDVDLSNAIALFFWLATDQDNPQGAIFYLDDIKFEGVK